MDLSENAELQAIFRDEVVDRSTALIEGGKAMAVRQLQPAEVGDRRRDAHTIKGNALVMGYPHMAEAAKLLERAFRDLDEAGRKQTPELGHAIEATAAALPNAIELERAGEPAVLIEATESLRGMLSEPGSRSSAPPAPPPPPAPKPVAREANPTPRVDGSTLEVAVARENLGGLTAELSVALTGESTRVDAAALYGMINEVVELRLDADALTGAVAGLKEELDALHAGLGSAKLSNLRAAADRFSLALRQLEDTALTLPSVPFGEVTATFGQLVRFLARRLNKDVALHIVGDALAVDRQLVDQLREPLRHLVVNAVDHGVEPAADRIEAGKTPTASVFVRFERVDHQLQVSVMDDGRGIDWQAVTEVARSRGLIGDDAPARSTLQGLLYAKGFSTKGGNDDVSGDGTGLAMVAELAERLNGSISLSSRPGKGMTVRMTLPSSLALQGVLVVEESGHRWGLPIAAIDTTVVVVGESHDGLRYRGTSLPVRPLADALGLKATGTPEEVVVLTSRGRLHAFSVEKVIGRRKVAVKELGPMLDGSGLLCGAAILGGGQVIGIIEPSALTAPSLPARPESGRPRLLVVDDSRGARQLVAAALGSAGFDVTSAGDAAQALVILEKDDIDAVVCDFSMPGHTGIELVGVLRQRFAELPVVMVSGVATPEDQSAAYAAGVNAYLDKSDFREGVLASTVRSLLGLTSHSQEDES